MKADTLTLKDIFQKDIRYIIPTFQRPYVWDKEQQWEPLWEDIRNAADRYLHALENCNDDQAKAIQAVESHFMGAVVLQHEHGTVAEVEKRRVIDGQQRLLTLQLAADATQEVFEDIDAASEAKRLHQLVLNTFADGDHAFKVWPTSGDRNAFRAAMTNGEPIDGHETSLVVQAHDYFKLQTHEWIGAADGPARERRIHGLEVALFVLLELVVIDLDSDDDAFVIFETLNARGTPLLQSDLVKNYLLQTAASESGQEDALYKKYWKPLETPWWRKEIRQGRIYRPRLDIFLNYWLTMRTAETIQSHDVFARLKKYVGDGSATVDRVASDVSQLAKTYKNLEDPPSGSVEEVFLYRWRVVDAGVVTPVLLWLFSRDPSEVTRGQLERCLEALESYLVRRMLCRMTTADYNRLFLALLKQLDEEPGAADQVLVGFLAGQEAESRAWPTDAQLEDSVLDLPLYQLLTRARLRMVLEAIEEEICDPMTEELQVAKGKLTIEHVLPQSWHAHWPLPDSDDTFEAEHRRESPRVS